MYDPLFLLRSSIAEDQHTSSKMKEMFRGWFGWQRSSKILRNGEVECLFSLFVYIRHVCARSMQINNHHNRPKKTLERRPENVGRNGRLWKGQYTRIVLAWSTLKPYDNSPKYMEMHCIYNNCEMHVMGTVPWLVDELVMYLCEMILVSKRYGVCNWSISRWG